MSRKPNTSSLHSFSYSVWLVCVSNITFLSNALLGDIINHSNFVSSAKGAFFCPIRGFVLVLILVYKTHRTVYMGARKFSNFYGAFGV